MPAMEGPGLARLAMQGGAGHGSAMNRGVFFIDLDGTLVGRDGVDERVWEPLCGLRQEGWRLAVCTGRPGRGAALEVARRLDEGGLHVFESGAVVLDTLGRVVVARTLAPELVVTVAAFGARHGVTVEAYTEDGRFLVGDRKDPLVRAHEALLEIDAEEALWPPMAPIVRMQWNLPTTRWQGLRAAAGAVMAGLSAHEGRSPRMPGVSFISLTAPGVSKASGVGAVLDAYGLSAAQAAMAGDNYNDLEALRLVRWRFVPSDGAEEARGLADVLIPPPEAGGVGEAARWLRSQVG